jgi:[acyl-carrier-protein] S-malonyltransferase
MKLAFVFPGQGSQSVGMLEAYADLPEVRATFDEASAVLDEDLFSLVAQGPEAALNMTVNTQPVMLAADVGLYRAWIARGGPPPDVAAGHSLGEYAALVASGAISFSDAVGLVRTRARAMQEAVPEGQGGIAAILGLDLDQIAEACTAAAAGDIVSPANLNAPGQIVIAGNRAAVERAIELCKARGAKRAILLPMSVPSHCALMRPAADMLAASLSRTSLTAPSFSVINNADVATPADGMAIADALVRQLFMPVRWIETVATLRAASVTHIVECGPGKVLHGMVRRMAPEAACLTLSSGPALIEALDGIRQSEGGQ